jgi:thymidylate synthase ThyX
MGFFGKGRFCESLLQKLQSEQLAELSEIGKKAYHELSKVIPSFVRRGSTDHRHFQSFEKFKDLMLTKIKNSTKEFQGLKNNHRGARLIDFDEKAIYKVASALIFPHTDSSLYEIEEKLKELSIDEIEDLIDAASFARENRRHKSPRALERASFTFEITADFGCYRDLQRHRILTQDRQLLTTDLGYYIPDEILNTSMEKKYRDAMDEAKRVFEKIRKEFPEEAQYVVPMAYNIRWYFHVNLRSLQWLTELRSTPQGHPSYRKIAQEMAHQIMIKTPEFKRFLKFVDFEGYDLGRLDQEIRKEEKIGVK